MGILKKAGSWKINKHKRRVTFGYEEFSSKETPNKAKLHDGMSEKNRAWFNFIDFSITLQIDPEVAWQRVPKKHLDFVWNTIFDILDKYWLDNYVVSMPFGHRRTFSINKKYQDDMEVLAEWVYKKIHNEEYLVKNKEVCKSCNVGYLDYDVNDDKNWDSIKENCCSPKSVIPEYPDIITIHSDYGEIEI